MSQAEPNSSFKIHRLKNGLTIVGELMDYVSSAAVAFLVPAGAATDPETEIGSAAALGEMLQKGAGGLSSRQLSEAFENIGALNGHSSGIEVSVLSGALLGENVIKLLEIYAKILRSPLLPEDELASVKSLLLQEIRGIEDEPAAKVMVELARRFYPEPYGRPQHGTEQGISNLSIGSLRSYFSKSFGPDRAILGVAGRFDWDGVVEAAEMLFGDWQGQTIALAPKPLSRTSSATHIAKDTSQLQVALAIPSVAVDHLDYYIARVVTGILSGGMSGRLFIEVREKLGLVYRVSASHSAAKGRAAIFVYAGTTPENGEQTLTVINRELLKLKDGVTADELVRAKNDLKARLIMQGESTSVRASALVNDWWNLKRIRPLDEIKSAIDAVSDSDIRSYAEKHPPSPITLVTLGSKELPLPC